MVKGKENSEFKPVKFCLKIDLMLHFDHVEELVNTYTEYPDTTMLS